MTHSLLDISGKVCLVTGGTSGLGKAIALGYAQAGAKVIAASSNPDKVRAMQKELSAIGPGHDAMALNVTDASAVDAALKHAAAKYGRLDAVVSAAGVHKKQPTLEMPVEEFERVIRINLIGGFIVNQAAGKIMKDQTPDAKAVRGCIINIASVSSFMSLTEVIAYAASKTGIMGLTRGLANEWAPLGIRVNGIAPGFFPTDLNRKILEGTPRGEWIKKHTPMARFGNAEELVGAAIYLISDSASFTTGETLVVDGGFLTKGV
ncbi:MAG: SDR family oxidoreductase [Planctomycetia bacterium]|nr:SDR family oxidoreductase [Planctomycetia bacterium]